MRESDWSDDERDRKERERAEEKHRKQERSGSRRDKPSTVYPRGYEPPKIDEDPIELRKID